jgi:sulfur relay (sulfurtransferase) DsrC/TusE family protein
MNKPFRKLKRKVTCSVCHKLRIVTMYPESKADRLAMIAGLAKPYTCSDHAT